MGEEEEYSEHFEDSDEKLSESNRHSDTENIVKEDEEEKKEEQQVDDYDMKAV